ncbi:uncharacterized protein LOC5516214 isoform X2 [Nematostella vectensis]|uniref:uncharacterized protein LOC5516214 isoform X2 n=1 Tax=Nematostella vectensis TaxID=45351 RepID=UPI0013903E4B|nr:uncharacterized protein LOC5516214 isoform X2 [Nematostella vectensis]
MDKYARMVENLISAGIKLVAVDFDLTILNIHTRGFWQFTSKALVQRVRPCFQEFLSSALSSEKLFVAVVTQSPQVSLVREVLEKALPDCDTTKIEIRGNDGSWKEFKAVPKEGKQQHIESVIHHIQKKFKVKISPINVILLDDDKNNVEVARRCKMSALQIRDDDSLDELLDRRFFCGSIQHSNNKLCSMSA